MSFVRMPEEILDDIIRAQRKPDFNLLLLANEGQSLANLQKSLHH